MKSGRARSSIRLDFAALRSFYQFLVLRKIVEINVLKAVNIPKPQKNLPISNDLPGRNFPGKTFEN